MKNRISDQTTSGGLSETLAKAKDSLSGVMSNEQMTQTARSVEDYVTRHPALSLGVAVSVGVLLGCIIKRR